MLHDVANRQHAGVDTSSDHATDMFWNAVK
jgi:hypothetical protein